MRKLNSFFSRLCMVMLLALPMVFASCEDMIMKHLKMNYQY